MNYHISRLVLSSLCWRFGVAGIGWCSFCRLKPAKRNKIASDIKLVFHSSTITMMQGPINIRLKILFLKIEVITRGYAVYITLYYIFMFYYII